MAKKNENKRVAIVCQGGGSHTAFTAGALKRILRENHKKYEIMGLSGTSGGAISALLAWYSILNNDEDMAIRLLDTFWDDNSANSLHDSFMNQWIVGMYGWPGGVAMLQPFFHPVKNAWAQDRVRGELEKLVDFEKIEELIKPSSPDLLIGAVDINSGCFRIFKNAEVNADVMLASVALPILYKAVHVDGKAYWDGAFSQSSCVSDLVRGLPDARSKPDEIWIIQTTRQERNDNPKTLEEVLDRTYEISSHLSLNQEIDFIKTVNKWLKEGSLSNGKYKHIEVRAIEMNRDLHYTSKLDRSPSFIQEMMDYGESQAEDFLEKRPANA
ncbi:MAG TPA: patatin-like phospholipase family protein [Thermodesulfobacteriota bacterium]|nr:patatin-like phospholipase family protein [Thermodesulfobacteriota bacterium]